MTGLYGDNLDRVLNERIIVNRLMKEAEDMDQLAIMIKAELWALGTLYQSGKYYDISMEEEAIEIEGKDYVAVGKVFNSCADVLLGTDYKYIVPYSYIEDGIYVVEYKVM